MRTMETTAMGSGDDRDTRSRRSTNAVARGVFLAVMAPVLACAAPVEHVDEAPAGGAYSIEFPSVAAAVATDTVRVRVVDAADTTCSALVVKERSGQALPELLASGATVPPCAMLSAGGDAEPLVLPFGRRAFLAVGTRDGEPFLIGCAIGDLDKNAPPVRIPLTLFSNLVAVPATNCTTLSQRCAGGC